MSRQDYQSNSNSSTPTSMKGMPVNEWNPLNKKTLSSSKDLYSGSRNAYDNVIQNEAMNQQNTRSCPVQERRPRSPIQRILRYRLDDPELTSLNDTRYRPYKDEYNRESNNRRQNQRFRQPYSILPKNDQQDIEPPPPSHILSDKNVEQNLMDHNIHPSKEKQFTDRCVDLGVAFHWYRLKKCVNGEVFENVAIEMTYGQQQFKVYSGFYEPQQAKIIAFVEGLRRLEFLFGKAGETEGGFWNQAGESSTKVSSSEMLPNPFNEFQWQGNYLPPPPPPPPKFAPPGKPPLPLHTPPASPEQKFRISRMEPLAPGTNYGFNEAHNLEFMPYSKPRSSWAEMSSNYGFFIEQEKYANSSVNNVNQAYTQPQTDALISPAKKLETFQRIWTATDTPKTLALMETCPGPNESEFCKKIKDLGLFYRCVEHPKEIRNGMNYNLFEIQFWKWNMPSYQEKVVGNISPFQGIARESAFTAALQKIKITFEITNGAYNQDVVEDFSSNQATDDIEVIQYESDGNFPKRLGGKGRGLFINQEGYTTVSNSQALNCQWPTN